VDATLDEIKSKWGRIHPGAVQQWITWAAEIAPKNDRVNDYLVNGEKPKLPLEGLFSKKSVPFVYTDVLLEEPKEELFDLVADAQPSVVFRPEGFKTIQGTKMNPRKFRANDRLLSRRYHQDIPEGCSEAELTFGKYDALSAEALLNLSFVRGIPFSDNKKQMISELRRYDAQKSLDNARNRQKHAVAATAPPHFEDFRPLMRSESTTGLLQSKPGGKSDKRRQSKPGGKSDNKRIKIFSGN
jgi:hypothetical protein